MLRYILPPSNVCTSPAASDPLDFIHTMPPIPTITRGARNCDSSFGKLKPYQRVAAKSSYFGATRNPRNAYLRFFLRFIR